MSEIVGFRDRSLITGRRGGTKRQGWSQVLTLQKRGGGARKRF